MKEVKCKECQTWNDADLTLCTNCGVNLRSEEIKREEESFELFDGEPTKFERWLKRMEKSKNPLIFIPYRILKTIYVVYMAIVGFLTWLVIWFVG